VRHLLVLTACLLLPVSPGLGETANEIDREPAAEPDRAIEQHLLESMMRSRLADGGETPDPMRGALELMLRRTSPPLDHGQLAREFMESFRRLPADVDGVKAAWTAPLTTRREPREPASVSQAVHLAAIDEMFRSQKLGPTRCCPCSGPSDCTDNRFCNGTEVCIGSTCGTGPVPCGDDGDPCTIDTCSESLNQCLNEPAPPPPEVDVLLLDEGVAPGSTLLSWDPVAGADAYNLYAGGFTDLSDLTCTLPGLTVTSVEDSSAPSPLLIYLVSSDACSESGLGDATAGPRMPPAVCP
jgi:hypothetical protein